jgi:hypothetical protein
VLTQQIKGQLQSKQEQKKEKRKQNNKNNLATVQTRTILPV